MHKYILMSASIVEISCRFQRFPLDTFDEFQFTILSCNSLYGIALILAYLFLSSALRELGNVSFYRIILEQIFSKRFHFI